MGPFKSVCQTRVGLSGALRSMGVAMGSIPSLAWEWAQEKTPSRAAVLNPWVVTPQRSSFRYPAYQIFHIVIHHSNNITVRK